MPQRTCRPMAIAIMLTGSTLSIELSSVSTAPSGVRAHEVREVVDVRRIEAAADRDPGQDQRDVVDAAAHHALDRLELGDVGELEVRSGCPWRDRRLMCSSTHAGPAGTVISRYAW